MTNLHIRAQTEKFEIKAIIALLVFGSSLGVLQTALASEPNLKVAACKLSPQDMLRQPKDKPPVLAETIMDCGKRGQHSLEAFYWQGWRLIQVLPNGAYTNPWIGIFERQKQ